jgi:hypothetical protein
VSVASAQDQKSDKDPGGVLDVLQGIVRGDQSVASGSLALKTDDGQMLTIDTRESRS